MSLSGQPSLPFLENIISGLGSSTTNSRSILLPNGYKAMETDILCGRGTGGANSKHPGNQIFAERVQNKLNKYASTSSRTDRTLLVATLVDSLQCDGMRFIKFIPDLHRFVELSDDQAHAKVGHAIRDQIYKQNYYTKIRPCSKQKRSSSFPSTAGASKTNRMQQETKLKRRHSHSSMGGAQHNGDAVDAIIYDLTGTKHMGNRDDGQPPPFGTAASYNTSSLAMHHVANPVEGQEMTLKLSSTKSVMATTNLDDFQSVKEQRLVGHAQSSAAFDLDQDAEGILSNEYVPLTSEQVHQLLQAPLVGRQEEVNEERDNQPMNPKALNGIDHATGMTSETPSSPTWFPFSPWPLDSETNLELQDIEELHDILRID